MSEYKYDNLTKDQQQQILDQNILSHEERHFRATLDIAGIEADSTLEPAQREQALKEANRQLAQSEAGLGVLRGAKNRLVGSVPKDAGKGDAAK